MAMRPGPILLLVWLATAAGCTYSPECKDRPGGHFSNPVDLVETGSSLFVSNGNNRNTLCYQFLTRVDKSEFLSSSGELPKDFIETQAFPGTLALDPSGSFLYTVSRRESELLTIDTRTGEAISTLPVPDDPYEVVVLSGIDGQQKPGLALATLDSSAIGLFDLSDPASPEPYDSDGDGSNGITSVDVGSGAGVIPERLVIDPAGGRAWSLLQYSFTSQLAVEIRWNSDGFKTEPLRLDLGGLEAARTDSGAYDPDGQFLWISARLTDAADQFVSNALIHYDLAARRVDNLVPLEDGAVIRSMTLSGEFLYASIYGLDDVWVFDAANGALIDKIGVGDGPTLVKASLDGRHLWVLNYLSSTLMAVGIDPGSSDYHRVSKVLE